ncbi:MAG TPA: lipid A deacylase LpxR family protein [Puia sp.]|nr:lipid A deacylase LpxR family protein [Puia sp.]
MRTPAFYFFILAFTVPRISFSQAMDNTTVQRAVRDEKYFRFNYENDYFTRTDYYYTQGMYLEWIDPLFHRLPLSRLLVHPPEAGMQYGIALEHDAYTPQDYIKTGIQFGDRPFAAALFLKTFGMATDFAHKQRISSVLSTGVIGPAAGGKEIQTAIHHWTNNPQPGGWHNQIANDLVLNYQLNYQKQVFNWGTHFLATADACAAAGTLSDKANIGVTVMAGIFNDPFGIHHACRKKIKIFAYEHPEWNIVAFNASLQGGLFNKSSVYTIPAEGLSRRVFQNNWGIVMTAGRIYLEYSQSYISREFNGGLKHRWGGIQVGLGF